MDQGHVLRMRPTGQVAPSLDTYVLAPLLAAHRPGQLAG